MSAQLTRRAVLAAALAAPFRARASASPRVVALDWGFASTLIGLGVRPVGVAEQRLYGDWVGAPKIPDGVAEVGLRVDPSFDTLAALAPDLILTNPLHAALEPRLNAIAPTLANPTFSASRTPLANARTATTTLGARLGRPEAAAALIADADRRIARSAEQVQAERGRAFLPLSVIDRRHLTIYGEGSLFVDVLQAIGLHGLWPGPTSLWGSKTLAVPDLAGLPPGDLLVLDPLPAAATAALDPGGLLARLCVAERRQLSHMPAAWGFGDLAAAASFAESLATTLGRKSPA